jgi:LemA protein
MTTFRNHPVLWAVIGVLVLLVLWFFTSYNGLVTARENVDTSWAQVEAQYQRRVDLVPNLVSTVKGAARFEQETFTAVTEARSQWQSGRASGDREKEVAAAAQMESALGRLLVTFENYPQLQATQAFRDLMTQLEGTENRIATARTRYNEVVRDYNLRVKRFPGNIVARLSGFAPQPFFEAQAGSEKAPAVNFE